MALLRCVALSTVVALVSSQVYNYGTGATTGTGAVGATTGTGYYYGGNNGYYGSSYGYGTTGAVSTTGWGGYYPGQTGCGVGCGCSTCNCGCGTGAVYGGYPSTMYTGTYAYGPSVNVVSSQAVTQTTTTATTYTPIVAQYVRVPQWRVNCYGYWAGSTVLRLRFMANTTKLDNGTLVQEMDIESVEELTNRFVASLRVDVEMIQNGTFQATPEKRFVVEFMPVGSYVDRKATDGIPAAQPEPENAFNVTRTILVCLGVGAVIVVTAIVTAFLVTRYYRRKNSYDQFAGETQTESLSPAPKAQPVYVPSTHSASPYAAPVYKTV